MKRLFEVLRRSLNFFCIAALTWIIFCCFSFDLAWFRSMAVCWLALFFLRWSAEVWLADWDERLRYSLSELIPSRRLS